jgi:hypothetical protein
MRKSASLFAATLLVPALASADAITASVNNLSITVVGGTTPHPH